jgi:enterochelin esterase-like enzyme
MLPRPQATPVPIANTELHEFTSSLVGQHYYIKVRLPEKYFETAGSYPVLYLLDGDHAFAMATDIVQYLIYGQHIPDLIIVSPAYGSKDTPEYGGTNMRNRDLVPYPIPGWQTPPGGARFLQFLEQELMPFVASRYRVDGSDRTLAGYSLGALLVLCALFQKPGLFSRLIAIDGIEDNILEMEEAFWQAHSTLPVRLFLSSGGSDLSGFADKLAKRGYAGLTVEHEQLNRAGHFTVGAEGLTKGLVSVFRQ